MLIITLLVPFILGIAVLVAILGKDGQPYKTAEKLAASFAIGLGILSILMFILARLNIPLTFINILLAAGLLTLISGFVAIFRKAKSLAYASPDITRVGPDLIRTKTAKPKSPGYAENVNLNLRVGPDSRVAPDLIRVILEYILISLIGLKVIFVFFSALVKPLVDVDAFQQYALVAKGMFFDKTFLLPYLEPSLGDKPLFPYMAQAWPFISLGQINDSLFKIFFPCLFLCFLIIFYALLKRNLYRFYALLFTFLLSSLPFMVYHATTAYADFSITFYFSIGTIYLFLFIQEFKQNKNFSDLFLAMLFLGIAIWVKKGALVLVGINFVIFLAFLTKEKLLNKDNLKKISTAFVVFLILTLPWIAYGKMQSLITISKSMVGIENPNIAIAKTNEISLTDKLGTTAAIFSKKVFLYADWHLLYLLFFIVIIFFWKQALKNFYLLTIILADLIIIIIQFQSGEMFRWLLDGTLLDRLLMNQAPLILFFCALTIFPGWKGNFLESADRA